MSVVADVFEFLEDSGVTGGSTGWTLLRRRMNDAVGDQVIVLTEDGGMAPEIGRSSGIGDSAMRDLGVQIMVRAGPWDGDASQEMAEDIFGLLHGLTCVEMGSTEYVRVAAQTAGPIFAGFDEKGRPLHTIAFRCMTRAFAPTGG